VKLPEISIKRPVMTLMFFLGVIIIGGIVLLNLKVDLLPDIEPPVITILTSWPGASAVDVEQRITKEIEDEMSTVEGVDDIISNTLDGISAVSVKFKWGEDTQLKTGDIRDAISRVKYRLPADANDPIVLRITSGTIPVVEFTLTAERTFEGLYHFADRVVSDELSRVPGVGQVMIFGGKQREIKVSLKLDSLEGYGLSPAAIIGALKQENINIPSGSLKEGSTEYYIRVPGRFRSVDEIRKLVVAVHKGRPVLLEDVADVVDGYREPIMYGWQNDKESVVLIVMKNGDANTVEVASAVKERMEELKRTRFPSDVNYTVVMDTSEFILNSLKNLSQSLIAGIVLVFVVTLLFLRRLPASLTICGAIPFSLVVTFIAMGKLGFTINVFTLSALAMASGMVVDNAVVTSDQIIYHIEKGERKKVAALLGASEVGEAIMGSTLTTVVVLLPLAFISGLVGVFFKSLSVVMVLAVSASLFVSLTFIPMMASKVFHRSPAEGKFLKAFARLFERMEERYGELVAWALENPMKIILLSLALMTFTIFGFRLVGTELTPDPDTGDVQITFQLPEGTRLEETDKFVRKVIEHAEQTVPEARFVFGFDGREEEGFSIAVGQDAGPNIGTVGMKLINKNKRERSAFEVAEELRQWIRSQPGIEKMTVQVTTPIRSMFLGTKPISIEVYGDDLVKVSKVAESIVQMVKNVPGAVDVGLDQKHKRPEVWIEVDREKAALMGIRTSTIAQTLRTFFYGYSTNDYGDENFWEGEDDYPIRVQLNREERDDLSVFERLMVPSETGKLVRLSTVARIVEAEGLPQITRKDRQRYLTVGANVQGRSLGEVTKEISRKLSEMELPEGVRISFGGQVKEQKEAFTQMGYLVLLGILLVYMVMAGLYEAYLDPLVIMFSIPFALTGVVFAYLVTGIYLSLQGMLGIIMLVGIVVNIAIVLVDYINLLRARGRKLREAIVEAGRRRLRSVLMTTLTTFFGMLPMAVSRGEGAELWRPLAVSVMGGLLVSMFVTLLLIPVMYCLVEEKIRRQKRFVEAKEVA